MSSLMRRSILTKPALALVIEEHCEPMANALMALKHADHPDEEALISRQIRVIDDVIMSLADAVLAEQTRRLSARACVAREVAPRRANGLMTWKEGQTGLLAVLGPSPAIVFRHFPSLRVALEAPASAVEGMRWDPMDTTCGLWSRDPRDFLRVMRVRQADGTEAFEVELSDGSFVRAASAQAAYEHACRDELASKAVLDAGRVV